MAAPQARAPLFFPARPAFIIFPLSAAFPADFLISRRAPARRLPLFSDFPFLSAGFTLAPLPASHHRSFYTDSSNERLSKYYFRLCTRQLSMTLALINNKQASLSPTFCQEQPAASSPCSATPLDARARPPPPPPFAALIKTAARTPLIGLWKINTSLLW